MKPNQHRDPLDQKIDALLASRPLKPSDDFANRVLAAAEADASSKRPKRPLGTLLKFALPLAAAVALTFSLLQLNAPATDTTAASLLSTAEAQEIFLLEESLAELAAFGSNDLGTENLLATFDALYLEI